MKVRSVSLFILVFLVLLALVPACIYGGSAPAASKKIPVIPIGMAYSKRQEGGNQSDWVTNYDLKSYPGKIYEDGVGALIDIIKKSPEKITVIAIGPVPNLAEALRRDPSIAENANFVGMHGNESGHQMERYG
jgi:inosine-uridine nucleoside N-ribohydrolase